MENKINEIMSTNKQDLEQYKETKVLLDTLKVDYNLLQEVL